MKKTIEDPIKKRIHEIIKEVKIEEINLKKEESISKIAKIIDDGIVWDVIGNKSINSFLIAKKIIDMLKEEANPNTH